MHDAFVLMYVDDLMQPTQTMSTSTTVAHTVTPMGESTDIPADTDMSPTRRSGTQTSSPECPYTKSKGWQINTVMEHTQ